MHRVNQDLQHALRRQEQAAQASDDHVMAHLNDRIDAVKGLTHRVAVGGLREQVLGWSLLFCGFVLQAISQGLQFHTK